ncbi:MAG: hypothetical protein SFY32_02890 [Bacteroidota bacterium]|nr:hypothetical protein [Bacteroidota bacterium]
MKSIIAVILFIASFNIITAQDSIPKKLNQKYRRHTAYFEILGLGGFYSLNYDVLTKNIGKWKQSFGVGASSYYSGSYVREIHLPISYNFLYGKRNGHLELSLVLNLKHLYVSKFIDGFFYNKNYNNYFSIGNFVIIGYRYQRQNGGFFFKTNAGMGLNYYLFSLDTYQSHLIPLGYSTITFGLSLGYTF